MTRVTIIEKSLNVSKTVKYARFYEANRICNCDSSPKCKLNSSKKKIKDDKSSNEAAKSATYRTHQSSFDSSPFIGQSGINSPSRLEMNSSSIDEVLENYYENSYINNLANYVKVLKLNDDKDEEPPKTPISADSSPSQWKTCMESFSDQPNKDKTPPPRKSTDLQKTSSSNRGGQMRTLDELIQFLEIQSRSRKMRAQDYIKAYDPYSQLSELFLLLNRDFFNCSLNGVYARWSRNCSGKKIDFDLEELCNGRFIWTLKFSHDELYSTCSREDLLRLLLFEMSVAYLNMELNTTKYNYLEEPKLIGKFQSKLDFLLQRLTEILKLDLKNVVKKEPLMYNYSLKLVEYEGDNDEEYASGRSISMSLKGAATFLKTDDVDVCSELHLVSYNKDELDLIFEQDRLVDAEEEAIRLNSSSTMSHDSLDLADKEKKRANDASFSLATRQSTIPSEFSLDLDRMTSLTQKLIDFSDLDDSKNGLHLASEDLISLYDDSSIGDYQHLSEFQSGDITNKQRAEEQIEHTDGPIIESEVVEISCSKPMSSLLNQVERPYRKSGGIEHHHHQQHHQHKHHHHHQITTNIVTTTTSSEPRRQQTQQKRESVLSSLLLSNKNDVALKKWTSELETEARKSTERRSLPSEPLANRQFVDYNRPLTVKTAIDDDQHRSCRRRPAQEQAIAEMRQRLFSAVSSHLSSIVISPLRLAELRLELVQTIRMNEANSVEQFVLEIFDFFSAKFFFKLLDSVKIEWSYRLKSSAATTTLVKSQEQLEQHHNHNHHHNQSSTNTSSLPSYIAIRLSWNLLNKLSRVELIKIILDEKHDANYTTIKDKLDFIVRLKIPIEHDYEETLDMAYVWICSKCKEKRIRFYNIPPTENQREQHALKCNGVFNLIKEPKTND